MKLLKTTLLALLFVIPLAAAEVSSETAVSAAQPYLKRGEGATVAGKYSVRDASYWIVYFHPENYPQTKNLVVAVNAETGELVSDRDTLTQLHILDFRAAKLAEFTSRHSVSFTHFRALADNYKAKMDSLDNSANPNSIHAVSSALERNFTDLDFTRVLNSFESAREYYDTLDEGLSNGLEAEQAYSQTEISSRTQNALLAAYNATLGHFNNFLAKIDDYEDALMAVWQAAAAYPAHRSYIIEQLGLLTFAERPASGTSRYDELKRYADLKMQYSRLLSTEEAFVNDSVQSFLDRKEFIDKSSTAAEAYARLRPAVQAITSTRKTQYERCDVDTAEIESEWKPIESLMSSSNPTAATYAQAIEKLGAIELKISAAQSKYERCTAPRETTNAQEARQDWLLPVLAVVVIGAVVFLYTRQKKKEEETIEPQTGKSLW